MGSYYKKIDGKNYDRTMLDIAESSVTGKGDGRISLADSRNIIKSIKDGGKVTEIEKRTLNYILEKFKFTETAIKHVEKSLSDNLDIDIAKDTKDEKSSTQQDEILQIKPSVQKKSKKNIFIILILLLLAVFSIFTFFKYFYTNNRNENIVTDNKEQISAPVKDESSLSKTESITTTPTEKKNEPISPKTLSDNEYIVKDKDTLIKISEALFGDYRKWEAIYKLNKGKISNPNILYPGQILIVPEKSSK